MRLITVCGPTATGKTSVLLHAIGALQRRGRRAGVIKMDCLATGDDQVYAEHGIPVQVGLSGGLCPDHYFSVNIDECCAWAEEQNLDFLLCESAGLCNRCSPHIKGQYAVCVIDNLMGADAPRKIGPMLKMADAVVITKGDIVSQAEREVFAFQVRMANTQGLILHVNGHTGQGCDVLADVIAERARELNRAEMELCFPMPSALCAYCLGQTRLSGNLRFGTYRKIEIK